MHNIVYNKNMLNKQQIIQLIEEKSLLEEIVHLDTQLTPNGFDMTVATISSFDSPGELDFSNSERVLPKCTELEPQKRNEDDDYGWWELAPGIYKVKSNERFNMPNDLIALAFPRSSLLRMGAVTHTGVWEAGFRGKAEFALIVENSNGICIKENARITQVVFVPISEVEEGYDGQYQDLE